MCLAAKNSIIINSTTVHIKKCLFPWLMRLLSKVADIAQKKVINIDNRAKFKCNFITEKNELAVHKIRKIVR